MLFRRLIETNSRAKLIAAAEIYAASVVAHVAIIGSTLVATREVNRIEIADSFTPVSFFIPKDKLLESRPKQERVSYVSVDADQGGTEGEESPEAIVPKREAPEPGPGLDELSSQLSEEPETAPAADDSVMTVLQVDTAAARYDDSAAPPYPVAMLERRLEGNVAIQYVVDTTGQADTASVVILSTTHPEFAESVRTTLPLMRFRPAIMNTRKVRQLVQQLFSFRIDTTLFAQQAKKPSVP